MYCLHPQLNIHPDDRKVYTVHHILDGATGIFDDDTLWSLGVEFERTNQYFMLGHG